MSTETLLHRQDLVAGWARRWRRVDDRIAAPQGGDEQPRRLPDSRSVAGPNRREWGHGLRSIFPLSQNNRRLLRSVRHARDAADFIAFGPAAPKARALPLRYTPTRFVRGYRMLLGRRA
jgi:hypothetical protein